jgi:hypothetical protein
MGGIRIGFIMLAGTAAMLLSASSAHAQWKYPPPGGGFGPIWGGGKNGAPFMEEIWRRECGVPGRSDRARYLAVYQHNPVWIYAQCYERVTRQYLPRPGQQRPGMPW